MEKINNEDIFWTNEETQTVSGNNGFLKHYYDIKINDSLKEGLKKDKWVVTDIDYNNSYLIYNTPKQIKYLKKDGSLLNLTIKYYCYYIEVNTKNWEHKIKKISNNFLLAFDLETWELNDNKTEELLKEKLFYDLAQIEKKSKWKIFIHPSSINVKLINLSLCKYEVTFITKKWQRVKKIIRADVDTNEKKVFNNQIKILVPFLLKKYSKKYEKVEKIYQIDYSKTFWTNLFVTPSKRKPLSKKDLLTFTYKLSKIYEAKRGASFWVALEELIKTSNWNVRNTAIALKNITDKNPNAAKPDEAMKILNEEDFRNWKRINFDVIYLAMADLLNSASTEWAEVFKNIANILERELFLRKTLKSAVKKPLFVISFILWIWIFVITSFSWILFEIHDWLWIPRPAMTVFAVNFMEFVKSNIFLTIFFVYLFFVWFNYFSKHSFVWRKIMHSIYITSPLFWNFIKKSEYEIFLTVAKQLYWTTRWHEHVLPILKKTVENVHIKWVINTAAEQFILYKKITPGQTFDKFPQYIDPRISNILKPDVIDTNTSWELWQLIHTYRIDNDEFILSLKEIINTTLLLVGAAILITIMFATIIPMIELATKF